MEDIKASEKGERKKSRIGKVNQALPALIMARRIQENAAEVGFDWNKIENVVEKVDEELIELKEEIFTEEKIDERRVEEEIGDLLFATVNLSRHLSVDPENALRKATDKFISRFIEMEKMAENDGMIMEKVGLDKLDEYWNAVKKNALQNKQ